MDLKTQAPSFTVSLRGYDREEVDEYLDSLAEALGQVNDAEEHNRRLHAHINRLNSRIRELEERIRSDEPRSGSMLAERIGILLREAEDAATETISTAEVKAAGLIAEAEAKVAEAEQEARASNAKAEQEAQRIEAAARAGAAEVEAEAEARAVARTRQIEQWAEQVVSHTHAEEARMLREQQQKKVEALADLKRITDERAAAAATLTDLRGMLGRALELVDPPSQGVDDATSPAGEGGTLIATGSAVSTVSAEAGEDDGEEGAGSPMTSAGSASLPADPPEGSEAINLRTTGETPAIVIDDLADDDEVEGISEAEEDGTSSEGLTLISSKADVDDETDVDDDSDDGTDGDPGSTVAMAGGASTAGSRPTSAGGFADFGSSLAAESEGASSEGDDDADEVCGMELHGRMAGDDDDDFEARLEAWVSEGAKHFRRS